MLILRVELPTYQSTVRGTQALVYKNPWLDDGVVDNAKHDIADHRSSDPTDNKVDTVIRPYPTTKWAPSF